MDSEEAATKIAAIQKGKLARRELQEEDAAAVKLQSIQRGNNVRSGANSPEAGEPGGAPAVRRSTGGPSAATFSQLGLKAGLPADPVPGLRFLTFYSWWMESGTKRYMEICFDLQSELFQLVLDKTVANLDLKMMYNPLYESMGAVTAQDTKVMSMHLHEKLSGNQHAESLRRPHLQGWDLHVGCRLNILGRPTTLMQCNLLTGKWLEYHADRLGRIKKSLAEMLRKYETVPVLAAIHGQKRPPVRGNGKQGAVDLRLQLNQIDALQIRLARYRPSHAAQLAALALVS
jgi:hypothetical protein